MITFTKSLMMNMNDRVDAVFVQFQHLRCNVRIFWRGSQMGNSFYEEKNWIWKHLVGRISFLSNA